MCLWRVLYLRRLTHVSLLTLCVYRVILGQSMSFEAAALAAARSVNFL